MYLNIFRTEEAAKYLEATKLQTSNGYSEEFTVMDDLMGLAIGEIEIKQFDYKNKRSLNSNPRLPNFKITILEYFY